MLWYFSSLIANLVLKNYGKKLEMNTKKITNKTLLEFILNKV